MSKKDKDKNPTPPPAQPPTPEPEMEPIEDLLADERVQSTKEPAAAKNSMPASVPQIADNSAADQAAGIGLSLHGTYRRVQERTKLTSKEFNELLNEAEPIEFHAGEIIEFGGKVIEIIGPEARVAESAKVYLGDADRPATATEIAMAVSTAFGEQIKALQPDPVQQAQMIASIVGDIVKKLREPSEEEKAAMQLRKVRREQLIKEQFENLANGRLLQDLCPHERGTVDGKSHSTVTALHNYVDGVVRGVCCMCQKIIEPGDESYRLVKISHALAMSSAI